MKDVLEAWIQELEWRADNDRQKCQRSATEALKGHVALIHIAWFLDNILEKVKCQERGDPTTEDSYLLEVFVDLTSR